MSNPIAEVSRPCFRPMVGGIGHGKKKRGEESRHGLSEGFAFVTRRGKKKRDGISTRLFFTAVDAAGKNQSKSAK